MNDNTTFKLYLDKDGQDLDSVYLTHYAALHQYAYTMLNDGHMAEEMVHQVFLKLMERSEPLNIHTSVKAYLYRSVNNECLNYIKHQKVKQSHQTYTMNTMNHQTENPAGKLQYKELEQHLRKAINDLPEQCRIIFQMSRFEELKYSEIAAELGIAVKTVENQMSKALKRLRLQLADYLPILLWLLINLM
ncbi:RNA polymerase sigma-70 factor [Mucilaginibacter agri]|uniref:RNA polymerase sigma-70 factor n=1 Tax=Mucilaginibacter agri TaxID=2695265 RepID=A0A965ZHG9_9SPHI|nr:RNA polymerase sigma-70 factor [Mucilaginibacter agri]NCD71178.1 RNA polymerase sigma-70 factor [Mucilaginibacter agri]